MKAGLNGLFFLPISSVMFHRKEGRAWGAGVDTLSRSEALKVDGVHRRSAAAVIRFHFKETRVLVSVGAGALRRLLADEGGRALKDTGP